LEENQKPLSLLQLAFLFIGQSDCIKITSDRNVYTNVQ